MANLGFIGLGAMGAPMAAHLLRAGHSLRVYARRAAVAAPLLEAGAVACVSPSEVAAGSDVVFTAVTDTAAVQAVVLGPDGIVAGARPGTVVIDHSTISPEGSRRIAASLKDHGVDMLARRTTVEISGGLTAIV